MGRKQQRCGQFERQEDHSGVRQRQQPGGSSSDRRRRQRPATTKPQRTGTVSQSEQQQGTVSFTGGRRDQCGFRDATSKFLTARNGSPTPSTAPSAKQFDQEGEVSHQ